MKFLDFEQFLNEAKELSLSFKVDDLGNVDILGRKFTIKELLADYGHIIDYAFATYLDKRLMYIPREKKFKIARAPGENGKTFDIAVDRVKFRTVKVMPEFITGMEIEGIMKSNKNAADYRDKKHYIEILDYEDNVIKTYNVDKKTGELS